VHIGFWYRRSEGSTTLGRPRRRSIILKWILMELFVSLWTELILLRVTISGELLIEMSNEFWFR